jgi:hypothetical protein
MDFMDYPVGMFLLSLALLWLSVEIGTHLRRRQAKKKDGEHEDLVVILGACLTLLGLIIGFSFSMATSRYDQRKNYEEAEANAIGTAYVRAGLLPAADAARVRSLLKSYLEQRILFYTTRNGPRLNQINAATAQLQNDLWLAVQGPAIAEPNPVRAMVAWGMNDVLNSQGYTQAAWWNRIPIAAWALMFSVGVFSNILFGLTVLEPRGTNWRFFVLPVIVSVSFFLIAELDSPVSGVVHVTAQNLASLAESLRAQ